MSQSKKKKNYIKKKKKKPIHSGRNWKAGVADALSLATAWLAFYESSITPEISIIKETSFAVLPVTSWFNPAGMTTSTINLNSWVIKNKIKVYKYIYIYIYINKWLIINHHHPQIPAPRKKRSLWWNSNLLASVVQESYCWHCVMADINTYRNFKPKYVFNKK